MFSYRGGGTGWARRAVADPPQVARRQCVGRQGVAEERGRQAMCMGRTVAALSDTWTVSPAHAGRTPRAQPAHPRLCVLIGRAFILRERAEGGRVGDRSLASRGVQRSSAVRTMRGVGGGEIIYSRKQCVIVVSWTAVDARFIQFMRLRLCFSSCPRVASAAVLQAIPSGKCSFASADSASRSRSDQSAYSVRPLRARCRPRCRQCAARPSQGGVSVLLTTTHSCRITATRLSPQWQGRHLYSTARVRAGHLWLRLGC